VLPAWLSTSDTVETVTRLDIMATKLGKDNINCWSAMDKLADCATKLINRGSKSTPGFCSQNIEERLQAHHAAMDFSTGAGGRIINDPMEAALIAKTGSKIRSLHPCLSTHQSSSLSSLHSPDSPLTTVTCMEPWFRPGLGRDQANLALFPHRASDGVFLIRACSRSHGGYVLSFTTQTKIVHAQIVRVMHDGKMAFSLDGGKTKFPSLEHLVDFHRMNTGPLPNILRDSSFVCSTAPPSPSACKEPNNNNNNSGVSQLNSDLQQEVEQSS